MVGVVKRLPTLNAGPSPNLLGHLPLHDCCQLLCTTLRPGHAAGAEAGCCQRRQDQDSYLSTERSKGGTVLSRGGPSRTQGSGCRELEAEAALPMGVKCDGMAGTPGCCPASSGWDASRPPPTEPNRSPQWQAALCPGPAAQPAVPLVSASPSRASLPAPRATGPAPRATPPPPRAERVTPRARGTMAGAARHGVALHSGGPGRGACRAEPSMCVLL